MSPFLGPLTLRDRWATSSRPCSSLIVALAVVRDPRPRTLVLGLAAATLVAFCFLTSMHERYSYGALIFLMLLVPDVRMRWLGVAFGIVFTLNVLAAVPPTPGIEALLPGRRPARASPAPIAMLAITVTAVALLVRTQDHRAEVEGRTRGL